MDQEATEVIDENEEIRSAAPMDARMRNERAHQYVAHPALVGPYGFEAAERARLTGQGGAVQPAAMQMLADGPLG